MIFKNKKFNKIQLLENETVEICNMNQMHNTIHIIKICSIYFIFLTIPFFKVILL